jgi:CBS domain containing-hemolysin-like protein
VHLAMLDLQHFWNAVVGVLQFDPGLLTSPEMVVRLVLQGVLLCGSAFFSGSETALFSLSRLDFQQLRRERNPRSEILHALLDQPRRLIISILCGNELVNIAAAANMTGILMVLYGPEEAGTIAVILMVILLLLFGEVTPKTIAVSNPVRVSANVVAGPINLWVKLITPLRWVIRLAADRITSMIVGQEKGPENILRVDEFRSLVEEVAKGGELDATERALIHHLLDATDTEIVEIMIPRTRTRFLDADLPVPELIEQFKRFRHSRVPVCRFHRDNLVGFLHAEVVLRLILDDVDLSRVKLEDILRTPVVVPLTKKVDEMFDFFQAKNVRAAVCLNEFGGVEGFITITDVLNFIFGHVLGVVHGSELYQERDENSYDVPGEMKLTDFNNLTHFGLEDPRMTTIGGVAFRHLDRLPKEGDSVVVEGVEITVLEMDGHRIAKVRVSMGESEDTDEPSGPMETSAPVDVPERESRESQSRAQDQGGS